MLDVVDLDVPEIGQDEFVERQGAVPLVQGGGGGQDLLAGAAVVILKGTVL